MDKASKDGKMQHTDDTHSISSTVLADKVMKFRLRGSVSDPLNLQGCSDELSSQDCPSFAPSPILQGSQPPLLDLPLYLRKDPLNIEGKSRKRLQGPSRHFLPTKAGTRRKTRYGRRSTSHTDDRDKSRKMPKNGAKFSYGNYDRYYGYRNRSVHREDLRLSLIQLEWIQGKECLDIGCNTGDLTIKIGRNFHPKKIVGIDIDPKLIQMAWKNLHRELLPTVAPDGRQFPQSFALSHGTPSAFGPPTQLEDSQSSLEDKFPNNIDFRHCNFMSKEGASQETLYDTVLALSVTKWIHLNWGDEGIKRFFKKIYDHLRPGGHLILEPQPFSSYSKKKNLTPEISKNYNSISLFPQDFHDYLMSSEIGFDRYELLGIPDNSSKGFQRPLHLYSKVLIGSVKSTQDCDKPADTIALETMEK